MEKTPIFVAASVDVEEEGLFTGKYACKDLPMRNLEHLKALIPLLEKGLHPTLFCVREVFLKKEGRQVLALLSKNYPLEIGCHLHHWNTPPFAGTGDDKSHVSNVESQNLDRELLNLKFEELFRTAGNFLGEKPRSFRMGRWDLHKWQMELLAGHGIENDASIRPCHAPGKHEISPDHFDFPDDPFWMATARGKVFEVPLTVFPVLNKLRSICEKQGSWMRGTLKKWGALALLPVYHPLWLMKIASRMHIARGGRVLSLTWHSSEMMPGGAPHMPDRRSVQKLLAKLEQWFQWLKLNFAVESLTVRELHERFGPVAPVIEWSSQSSVCPAR